MSSDKILPSTDEIRRGVESTLGYVAEVDPVQVQNFLDEAESMGLTPDEYLEQLVKITHAEELE